MNQGPPPSGPPPSSAPPPAPQRAPMTKEKSEGIATVIVLLVLIVLGFKFCGGSGGEEEPKGSFSENLVDYDVINPATIQVYAETTNEGTETATADCRVAADGGGYSGFDLFEVGPIEPGKTERWKGTLTITDEGAQYVTKVQVRC